MQIPLNEFEQIVDETNLRRGHQYLNPINFLTLTLAILFQRIAGTFL